MAGSLPSRGPPSLCPSPLAIPTPSSRRASKLPAHGAEPEPLPARARPRHRCGLPFSAVLGHERRAGAPEPNSAGSNLGSATLNQVKRDNLNLAFLDLSLLICPWGKSWRPPLRWWWGFHEFKSKANSTERAQFPPPIISRQGGPAPSWVTVTVC